MADIIYVKITGGQQIQQRLQRLAKESRIKILRRALQAGAQIFTDACVSLAPRDTGFLAEHFGWRSSVKGDLVMGSAYIGPQGKVYYPVVEGKKGKLRRMAVATIARFLEFGTTRMAPRPFMTQAFESSKQQVLDRVMQEIQTALSEEVK